MFSVWIYSLEKEFKKFVQNRVLEIFQEYHVIKGFIVGRN